MHCKPSQVKDHLAVFYTTLDRFEQPETFGKWMVFKPLDKIDETWEKIRIAVAKGELEGCEWIQCSTMMYDPTKEGPGISTSAVIFVHTYEQNVMAIGFKLIEIVQQDIRYKTNETSQKREFSFTANKRVTMKTIFWNQGRPSTTFKCISSHAIATDMWHPSVVTAPEPFHSVDVHGRWILTLEYEELTALWHHLKKIIESKEKNFGIVKMVCPPKHDRKSKDEAPVFHIYTSAKRHTLVGEHLVKIIQRDIQYELISHGESQGAVETLRWNPAAESDNRVREYLKAYNHVISTRATIELPFLKMVFLGAPRLGKTTMRRRLTREIDDINSAGEAEQPSTGIVESEHNVIIRHLSSTTTIVASSEWSSKKDISEEVRMLFQFISQTYDDVSSTEEKEASEITADNVHLQREPKASVRSTDLQDNVKPLPANTATGNEASSSNKDPIISDEDLREFLTKALSTDNWEEEIKYLLENTALLSTSDAGGQPEFMDMQPALVLGPALYLVFCNLSQVLQDHYSVSFLHSSDGSTESDKSFYTVEEVIFQTLSAITCLGKVDPVTTSVDPETSTELPTTSAAMPTTSAALPTTSAALPTTSAALPTTSAALPTTSAALPTTSAALPTTSAALPTTSAAMPTTSAALPTTSAALPTTSAALPTTSAALPTTTAALPTTTAALPTTRTTLPTYSTGQPPSIGLEATFSSSSSHLTLSKSKAMIVGTHRDLVSEDEVKEFDRDLQRKIRATDFFKEDIVQFATKDRLVLEVDNMHGGVKEVEKIQNIILNQMKLSFKKLSLPVSWLIFSLCLRKKALRMVSLQSCLDLAQQLNIPPDEAKLAMWFLHHYAGLLMHFPNLPELRDSVICDTQIVYDSVTHLIVNTYKFDNVSMAALEKFRDTGQFSLQDIKRAVDKDGTSEDHIPLNKLVQLLEYLNIIVPISQSSSDSSPSKEVYFMPCVLQNAPSAELKVSSMPDQVQPIPLMIRFTCGFVPTGVFTAMIANLVGQNSESFEMKGIKKNRVQFHYGNACDKVTVISKPKHYEIHISRLATARTPMHKVCTAVRDLIKRTLKIVASRFNYTFSLSYQFAFECPLPEHGGGDHLCVVKESGDAEPEVMTCQHNTKEDVPVVGLQDRHLVWFGKVSVFYLYM